MNEKLKNLNKKQFEKCLITLEMLTFETPKIYTVPLLDCAMNLVGFIMIGIFSAILWCNAVASTAVGLFMCGE